MSLLQAYLQKPSTQRVLSRKPGEKGFSLIELVVVVAVLAILAAIAIPAFTSINDNAAQAAAKNTIAQIAKECAVKKANNETPLTFNVPNINSYTITPANGDCSAASFIATKEPGAAAELPGTITYINTGANKGQKTCVAGTNLAFCDGGTW